jgi:hypothetical protein
VFIAAAIFRGQELTSRQEAIPGSNIELADPPLHLNFFQRSPASDFFDTLSLRSSFGFYPRSLAF